MNFDEAVTLRARQLLGETIAPVLVERAIAVIKKGRPMRGGGRKALASGPPLEVLQLLAKGPMERSDFYASATRIYKEHGRKQGPIQRIHQMVNDDWIVDEVRLTAKGLERVTGGDQ